MEDIWNWVTNLPAWVWLAFIIHGAILGTVAYLILLERKTASWVQDRIGPNRVGPGGLLQPLADGLKFIVKEDYRPAGVDKVLFTLAPGVMIFVIIISIAVLPWGGVREVVKTVDVSDTMAQKFHAIDLDQLPDADAAQRSLTGDPATHAAFVEAAREQVNGQIDEKDHPPVVTVEPTQINYTGAVTEPAHILATVTYRYPFQIARLDVGVLFILAVLGLAVYGVVIGGWASNNKYSFLGGLRATAQMISYEIPLGLCILAIVVMYGTLDLETIVDKQATYWWGFIPAWNVFCQPITFLMFLICIHAEANRAPFDMAEAEQELVGGYHTEYSSMRFALFFLAEYAGMITTSAVCVALFFGGWHFPGLSGPDPAQPEITQSLFLCIVRAIVFFTKTIFIIFVFMWVRWSLPRFRFDQLMMLAWRAMIPMSLALVMVTAVVVWYFGPDDRAHLRVGGRMAAVLLGANVVLIAATMIVSRIIPAAPNTNRKVRVVGSRFLRTPLPAPAAAAVVSSAATTSRSVTVIGPAKA